jgi:tryptophanyl-tRNA synthetase
MTSRKRIFSGIQPTGRLHIGNYHGAIKNWVGLLDKYECIYSIVDYHAMTLPYEPGLMQEKIFKLTLELLACGVDPNRCKLFVQSYVPEHVELAWIFNTITPIGLLERMTQYKDKSARNERIGLGLLAYPVLQAADILIYQAQVVPVGEDQSQHLELTRDIARKFNQTFTELFPEPETLISHVPRVLGLDGQHKMSKSLGNEVAIADSPADIKQKILTRGVTDTRRVKKSDPGVPEDCNMYTWHTFFSTPEEQRKVAEGCRQASIGCFECKSILLKNVLAQLEPIQARLQELAAKPDYIRDVLDSGARWSRQAAQQVMEQVRQATGLR